MRSFWTCGALPLRMIQSLTLDVYVVKSQICTRSSCYFSVEPLYHNLNVAQNQIVLMQCVVFSRATMKSCDALNNSMPQSSSLARIAQGRCAFVVTDFFWCSVLSHSGAHADASTTRHPEYRKRKSSLCLASVTFSGVRNEQERLLMCSTELSRMSAIA
jgi:hypothetical protein